MVRQIGSLIQHNLSKGKIINVKCYFFLTVLSLPISFTYAQNSKWDNKVSVGFGMCYILNMPGGIHNIISPNMQLGYLIERRINEKFSLISHLECDFLSYSFDGYLSNSPNNTTIISQAPDGIKYPGMYQVTIGGNIQGRYYFKTRTFEDKTCKEGSCIKEGKWFVQSGFRCVTPLYSDFHYRLNNSYKVKNLNNPVNPVVFQYELSIGIKGQVAGIFSILNCYSVGLIYQFTPIFNENIIAPKLNPLLLTTRIYF